MKKILVIDDISSNLVLVKTILTKHFPDFEILTASSGEKGLEIAEKELPRTILLDIYMPEMDGFEVCKHLKKDIRTKNIPILMISAYGSDSKVRVKGLNAGADAFISKPFHMEELVALVNVMLRIKNAEDLLRKQNKDLEESVKKLIEAEKIQKNNLKRINQYQSKLKRLNSELLLAEEKEKKAIAGYLHDGIGQTLSITHIRLTSLLNLESNSKIKNGIIESTKLIDSAIQETKLLTYDLSPPILYELGLIPALRWKLETIEKKEGINTVFKCSEKHFELETNSLVLVYRIVCELLINVIKHANANSIIVEVVKRKRYYRVTVSDDGIGFDQLKVSGLNKPGSYGLFSINERIDSINGKFTIKSNSNGTTASLMLPFQNSKK